MAAAHGGQVLVSQALAVLLVDRLPPGIDAPRLWARCACAISRVPSASSRSLHPALRREFPALRSLSSTPNNLPQQMTSFIGRDRELSEIRRALKKARLVTILGAGGLGKTRLSLQAAADVMDDYPDGVWLVELAPFADARMVPQAIASVLGVKEETGRPVSEALLKAVRRSPAAADPRQLRASACGLRRLVPPVAAGRARTCGSSRRAASRCTSRARRRSRCRRSPCPTSIRPSRPRRWPNTRRCTCSSTARRPPLPSFRVTDQNAAAVVDICRRLDGIPLAIELAAARVRALSVQAIAERLTNRFSLLTGGDRTALAAPADAARVDRLEPRPPDRKRADPVSPPCRVRGRLDARGGGARRSRGRVAEGDVLGLLADLVDKSLVMVDAEGGATDSSRPFASTRWSGWRIRRTATPRDRDISPPFSPWRRTSAPELLGPKQAAALARSISSARTSCRRIAFACARKVPPSRPIAWCTRSSTIGSCAACSISGIGSRWRRSRFPRFRVAKPGSMPGVVGGRADLQLHGPVRRSAAVPAREPGHRATSRRPADDRRRAELSSRWPRSARATGRRPRFTARKRSTSRANWATRREIAVASNALAQLHRLDGKLDAAEPLYEEVVALAHELGDTRIRRRRNSWLAMVAIGRGAAERARDCCGRCWRSPTRRARSRRGKARWKSRRALPCCGGPGALRPPLRRRGGADAAHGDPAGSRRTRRSCSRCSPGARRRSASPVHRGRSVRPRTCPSSRR